MNAATPETPKLTVTWVEHKVRMKARRNAGHMPWEWPYWEAKLANFTFRVGFLPKSVLDMTPAHRENNPADFPDSVWQLWTDFGTGTMEPSCIIGRCTQEEAFRAAEQRMEMQMLHERSSLEKRLKAVTDLWTGKQFEMGICSSQERIKWTRTETSS